MRQLATYEDKKAELEALGATIYAASVDSLEQAREVVSRGLTFPVAYGITREASEMGSVSKVEMVIFIPSVQRHSG